MKLFESGHRERKSRQSTARTDRVFDLRRLTGDIDRAFLAPTRRDASPKPASCAGSQGRLPDVDPAGLRIGAPVARPASRVRRAQLPRPRGGDRRRDPRRAGRVHEGLRTVVGPYDEVLIPRGSMKTDWEVELGVVIGRTARYLDSPDEAPPASSPATRSRTTSPSASSSSSAAASGTRASAARPSTRSARGWSRRTRSPTPRRSGCGCGSTASRARTAPPPT